MSLKERITEDMKAAMRAKDSERLGTIRMITSAIKQREVDERITLDDASMARAAEGFAPAGDGPDEVDLIALDDALTQLSQASLGRRILIRAVLHLDATLS